MPLTLGRRDAAVGAVVLALVAAGLVVQHLRHGWPFSLHHGMPNAPMAELAGHAAEADGARPAHPRVTVEVEPTKLAAIGIRTETVRRETLAQPVRAVATVVPDESRVSHVHTRVAGWIEKLYINTTGQGVRAGQPLAGIFSQELLSSQNEFLAARRAATQGPPSAVVEGARARLKVLGMTEAEIAELEKSGSARRLVTVSAPRSGVVIHRGISVGTAVDPSTELLTIADLSHVWVLAEVPEPDIPSVQQGTPAALTFPASGLAPLERPVDFLYPTLSEKTRTLRVRFTLDNPTGTLRPGLYGTADFRVRPREALTVPRDAVVDTGDMQHVFVVVAEGKFEPREVELGTRLGDRTEVLEGLSEGESIVASGVFLIDSESRLRASGGTGHAHGGHGSATTPEPQGSSPADEHPSHGARPSSEPKPAPAPPGAPARSGHEGHEASSPAPRAPEPPKAPAPPEHAHHHGGAP
jgi:Cu(I)/Ag(I) efflux system membrane fusion protein